MVNSFLTPCRDVLRMAAGQTSGSRARIWGWRWEGGKGSKPMKEGLGRSRQEYLAFCPESFGVRRRMGVLGRELS